MKNLELLEQARKQKKKIVLVTGVFDVLHEEHKRFLEAARKEGDFLLVGIESDVRVRKMKGESRPYFPEEKRKDHLEAWKIADSVFILPEKFSQPADHDAFIAQIRPHVLAVSEHTAHLPEKMQILQKYGGVVKVVLPHNPEVSTTRILESEGL